MFYYSALAHVTGQADKSPLWVAIPAAISSIITATGVVIAGVWAYLRFARGRILHASCQLGLSAKKLAMLDGTEALKITAIIENAGGLRLLFPRSSNQIITVFRVDKAMWEDAVQYGEVLWSEGRCHQTDMLTVEGKKPEMKTLEPGEQLRRCMLIPIADIPSHAYRISMYIEAQPKLMWRTRPLLFWETETVFGEKETVNAS
jgi:hypothetical protein